MTSHCDPIRHRHALCSECGHREAMTSLNARRSTKSRKAKRAGRYTLKAHDLCGPCWRSMCAQFWVHGESERAKDQMEASGPRLRGYNSPSPQRLDGSLSSEVSA